MKILKLTFLVVFNITSSELSKNTRNTIKSDRFPLHKACITLDENETKIFEGLCLARDVEEKDEYGMTPFLTASYANKLSFLKILLRYNANKNAADKQLRNALHLAIIRLKRFPKSSPTTLKWLIKNDINLEHRTVTGRTPFLMAVEKDLPEKIVNTLIESRCNINASLPLSNNTAAHLAALNNNNKIFMLLMNSGSDMFKLNNLNLRPLEYFREKRNSIDSIIKYNGSLCQICYNNLNSPDLLNCCFKNLCGECLQKVKNKAELEHAIDSFLNILLNTPLPININARCPFCRKDNPSFLKR